MQLVSCFYISLEMPRKGGGGRLSGATVANGGKEGVGPRMGRGEKERLQGSPIFMAPGGAAAKGMPPQELKEMSYLERKVG